MPDDTRETLTADALLDLCLAAVKEGADGFYWRTEYRGRAIEIAEVERVSVERLFGAVEALRGRFSLAPAANAVRELRCNHCEGVAIYAAPDGTFEDGEGYACQSCGIPGWTSVDPKTGSSWVIGDRNDIEPRCHRTPCEKCGTCACGCAIGAYPEAHGDSCPESATETWDPVTRTDTSNAAPSSVARTLTKAEQEAVEAVLDAKEAPSMQEPASVDGTPPGCVHGRGAGKGIYRGNEYNDVERALDDCPNCEHVDFYECIEALKARVEGLGRDLSDCLNARMTIFHRCACGRLREQGLVCPGEHAETLAKETKR